MEWSKFWGTVSTLVKSLWLDLLPLWVQQPNSIPWLQGHIAKYAGATRAPTFMAVSLSVVAARLHLWRHGVDQLPAKGQAGQRLGSDEVDCSGSGTHHIPNPPSQTGRVPSSLRRATSAKELVQIQGGSQEGAYSTSYLSWTDRSPGGVLDAAVAVLVSLRLAHRRPSSHYLFLHNEVNSTCCVQWIFTYIQFIPTQPWYPLPPQSVSIYVISLC